MTPQASRQPARSRHVFPRSLGLATDVALIGLQHGVVERTHGQLVLRTPANPTYHWGNCVLLERAPEPGRLADALRAFEEAHPDAAHVAIGIDQAEVHLDPDELAAHGLQAERDTVLTATRLVDDPRGAPAVACRPVPVDDDAPWAALVELEVRAEGGDDPDGHRRFVTRRYAAMRQVAAEGHGAWFAAYTDDGEPVGTLGIYRALPGVGRFQSVLTDPRVRRQGVAGALLRRAGRYAVEELGVRTLVIVADPVGPAIGLYRAAGFADREDQWGLYRPPAVTAGPAPPTAAGR